MAVSSIIQVLYSYQIIHPILNHSGITNYICCSACTWDAETFPCFVAKLDIAGNIYHVVVLILPLTFDQNGKKTNNNNYKLLV